MGRTPNLYALYNDDEFIALGTYRQLEELTGIKHETLRFYGSPSYMRRTGGRGYVLVRIEMEDDDGIQDA